MMLQIDVMNSKNYVTKMPYVVINIVKQKSEVYDF